MINGRRSRLRAAWAVVIAGLVLLSPQHDAPGQDAAASSAPAAVRQIVARLKLACESKDGLRGALVQPGELKDGTLILAGTVDRAEQAGLIEAEARQLLDDTPAWKAQIPGGVSAANLIVFPVRSDLLPRLRREFAKANADRKVRPDLFQQTRIDDVYYDRNGRLRVVGLCINQSAYVARKTQADDWLGRIADGIRDRLKGYALPQGVHPDALGHLSASEVAFQENPVRRLQRLANESQLDDLLFYDARFDAEGLLTLDGLLADENQRAAAAAFLARPEFVTAYARPGGKPPAEPATAVASMVVGPWRKTLLSGLQQRFAADSNRDTATEALRYCRLDRAVFIYPERGGGLQLRFEGVILGAGDSGSDAVTGPLRKESRLLFPPPAPDYAAQNGVTELPNPVRDLQANVAADPALDGVFLKDLTFGPQGETTFEGLWLGPAQSERLADILTPALAKKTRGKVGGPPTFRLKTTPTDRSLRVLRGKIAAEFDETSLDRLFFRAAEGPDLAPELVLQGATIAGSQGSVEARLEAWLKEDELLKTVGAPVVKQITSRPNRLVAELRKLVVRDPALDGVLVERGIFDEENVLVLSGRQDHEGQAQGVVPLAGKAAAQAWPDLSPPAAVRVRAGTFAVFPLRALLERLSNQLAYYPEANGVILERAYYNDASALVLDGRASGGKRDLKNLEDLIRKLIGSETGLKLDTPHLRWQQQDAVVSERIVSKAIAALIANNLTNFKIKDLDEAIFLNPSSSVTWYLRGAYHHLTGNAALAQRDLGRVHSLEPTTASPQFAERSGALVNFQVDLRRTLDEMVSNTEIAR